MEQIEKMYSTLIRSSNCIGKIIKSNNSNPDSDYQENDRSIGIENTYPNISLTPFRFTTPFSKIVRQNLKKS